jgi:DNA-nicking Smr family endonuclease
VSKRGRDLTPEEAKLWRGVTDRVRPRRKQATPPEEALRVTHKRETAKVPSPSPVRAAAKRAVSPPQNRGAEKRVRRGKLEIGASLDLHCHTQDSAHATLRRFLRSAQKRGERTVIVVTGVGRAGEGVLKRRLPDWLAEPELRAIVSGFAQAHRTHGGSGAFYVFLKRAPSTSG